METATTEHSQGSFNLIRKILLFPDDYQSQSVYCSIRGTMQIMMKLTLSELYNDSARGQAFLALPRQ